MGLFDLYKGSNVWSRTPTVDSSVTGTQPDANAKPFASGSLIATEPMTETPKEKAERELVNKMYTRKLPGSEKSLGDVSKEYGTKLGLDPEFLAGSFLGEGGNQIFDPSRPAQSDAYAYATKKGLIDSSKYKTDAFFAGGLDDAKAYLDEAKKKGYLSADSDYQIYPAINEGLEKNYIAESDAKGNITKYKAPKELVDRWKKKDSSDEEWVKANDDMYAYLKEKGVEPNQTAAFKNYDDMVAAKAATMKLMQDKIEAVAKDKKVNLSKEDKNYLLASAYNGGFGTAKMLLDKIASGDKDVTKSGIPEKKQVHNNIQQRLRWTGYLKKK